MIWGMIERFGAYKKVTEGKFFIIAVDKNDNDDSWIGSYDTKEAALEAVTENTRNNNADKIFLPYDPKGNYIGGDSWSEE